MENVKREELTTPSVRLVLNREVIVDSLRSVLEFQPSWGVKDRDLICFICRYWSHANRQREKYPGHVYNRAG